jgi:hypothetical protein
MAPKDNKANYRPIPIGVWEDIIKLLEERKIQIDNVLEKLESK